VTDGHPQISQGFVGCWKSAGKDAVEESCQLDIDELPLESMNGSSDGSELDQDLVGPTTILQHVEDAADLSLDPSQTTLQQMCREIVASICHDVTLTRLASALCALT
jgi:hypothetical protein